MKELVVHDNILSKEGLQLNSIEINEEYRKEWNINQTDFKVLALNGEVLNSNLYRTGRFRPNIGVDKYVMLLRYSEHIYPKEFIDKCYPNKSKEFKNSHRKSLVSEWVIIDNNGVEKVKQGKTLDSLWIIKDSCIYSQSSSYYNIETGYHYGNSSNVLESKEFIFLDNKYGGEKPLVTRYKTNHPRGIVKINKQTGEFEVIQ